MDIENLTIKEARQLAAMFSNLPAENSSADGVGHYCIVRCQKAGVHAGTVIRADRDWVVLKNSRRMWKWFSGFTLSEAANNGIDTTKSRIAELVETLSIPTSDVAEIIPCTAKAQGTIQDAKNG